MSPAQKNVEYPGLKNHASLRLGDLVQPFDSEEFHHTIDIITINLPYISSKKGNLPQKNDLRHELVLAFDGGLYGLNVIIRLIPTAPMFLKEQSFLCFEIGLGQSPLVARMLDRYKLYREVKALTDTNNNVRVFVARK